MTRTLTLIGWLPPTRKKVRLSSTRSSFTWVASGISPISSRKMVPVSASSNRPSRRSAAPVNAPFSCPNSSDSSSVSGSAAQLTAMNGLPRRGERSCSAFATNSLPVPLSPCSRTVLETGAICSILTRTSWIAGLSPMIPVRSWNRRRSISRRAVSTTSSGRAGFIIVSVTPSRPTRSARSESVGSSSARVEISASRASAASWTAWGSCTAPVSTTRSGFSRRTAPRASSSEDSIAVEKPAASSAAFSGTAVSRSSMVTRIWEDMGGKKTVGTGKGEGCYIVAVALDLREQLQDSLGEAYRIERELGGGGMSRVFLALETSLQRRVVVKVLLPELAAGVSVERFRREIHLAAQLQHPHIVPLLSAGESVGLPYFTMPYVDGESLRARLLRERELPVPHAVRVLRDVAAALGYAHAQGVVHRDIKPDNVLLSHGVAVVTDFGVAKALTVSTEAAGAPTGPGLTSMGVTLGTPHYMAPEQGTADPAM